MLYFLFTEVFMKKLLSLSLTLLFFAASSCSFFPAERGTDWTIMVYLASDNDLEEFGLGDINELENVPALENSGVNVVVLVDRVSDYDYSEGNWTGSRLYQIQPDNNINSVRSPRLSSDELGISRTGDGTELDMSDPETLEKFVDFCLSEFPASNTMLILWDHGGGWRNTRDVCVDETTSDSAIMLNYEAASAVAGKGIDIIGFDACLMGMAEVAYEFAPHCDIMVASPETIPGYGWNYDEWLSSFLSGAKTPQRLYTTLIDSYASEYSSYSDATLAAYDLSEVDALVDELSTAGLELCSLTNGFYDYWSSPTPYTNVMSSLFDEIEAQVQYYTENYDLYRLIDYLAPGNETAILNAVNSTVLYEWHSSGYVADSTGMSVYFGAGGSYANYTNASRFHNNCSGWLSMVAALTECPPYEIITTGSNYSSSLSTDYSKYYQFYPTSAGSVTLNLAVPYGADYDLYLLSSSGLIAYSIEYDSTDESVSATVSADQWYFVLVNAYEGGSAYTLSFGSGTATLH